MKSLYKISISIFLCLCAFSICVKAQSKVTEPAPLPPKKNQCNTELFNEANQYYLWRKLRSNDIRAERLIKRILDVCPNGHLMSYLQKRLEVLEEEKAGVLNPKSQAEFVNIYRVQGYYFWDRENIKFRFKDLKKKNMQKLFYNFAIL